MPPMRYVVEVYDDTVGPTARYYGRYEDALAFVETAGKRVFAFYLEKLVDERPEFSVYSRIRDFK